MYLYAYILIYIHNIFKHDGVVVRSKGLVVGACFLWFKFQVAASWLVFQKPDSSQRGTALHCTDWDDAHTVRASNALKKNKGFHTITYHTTLFSLHCMHSCVRLSTNELTKHLFLIFIRMYAFVCPVCHFEKQWMLITISIFSLISCITRNLV